MAKIKAKGVIVKYGDTASPSTTIPQLAEISFDNGEWVEQDVYLHDTAGFTVQTLGMYKRPSTVDLRIMLDPADTAHAWLIAAADSGNDKYLTLVLPDAGAAQWALYGRVRQMVLSPLTPQGMVEASFTFASKEAHVFTA